MSDDIPEFVMIAMAEHRAYGRRIAEGQFLEDPSATPDIHVWRLVFQRLIFPADPLPPLLSRVLIESALNGFMDRFLELTLHNLELLSSGQDHPGRC